MHSDVLKRNERKLVISAASCCCVWLIACIMFSKRVFCATTAERVVVRLARVAVMVDSADCMLLVVVVILVRLVRVACMVCMVVERVVLTVLMSERRLVHSIQC